MGSTNREKTFRIRIRETIATLICEEKYYPMAREEILTQRRHIEATIRGCPAFAVSMQPLAVDPGAPAIVTRMAAAAQSTGTGPMSAVAGAIAEFTIRRLKSAGARHAIMDNGGDIALLINRPVLVGIYAGDSPCGNLGLRILPSPGILGVCTSSGRVGHSISLGCAHAAVVVAGNVSLADAAATSLGNAIRGNGTDHLREVLSTHLTEDLETVMVVVDDQTAWAGRPPDFVRVAEDIGAISAY